MWPRFEQVTSRDVLARLDHLDLPFNQYGIDEYGVSKHHVGLFMSLLEVFYKYYFRVRPFGLEHIPKDGPGMLVGNHSGGVPADGGMVIASLFFSLNPPRHVHGMVEKFAQEWPFVSQWFNRVGQLPGLPEHAIRLLQDGRLLMVFPEGARGLGKLYKDRYHLSQFGTGFMRIALQTHSPVIPFAFIGGEEAMPTLFHAPRLARLIGSPHWPVPPYLLPIPMPLGCEIHYGKPMHFEGNGNEPDDVVEGYVEQVKSVINLLVTRGRAVHEQRRANTGDFSDSPSRPSGPDSPPDPKP